MTQEPAVRAEFDKGRFLWEFVVLLRKFKDGKMGVSEFTAAVNERLKKEGDVGMSSVRANAARDDAEDPPKAEDLHNAPAEVSPDADAEMATPNAETTQISTVANAEPLNAVGVGIQPPTLEEEADSAVAGPSKTPAPRPAPRRRPRKVVRLPSEKKGDDMVDDAMAVDQPEKAQEAGGYQTDGGHTRAPVIGSGMFNNPKCRRCEEKGIACEMRQSMRGRSNVCCACGTLKIRCILRASGGESSQGPGATKTKKRATPRKPKAEVKERKAEVKEAEDRSSVAKGKQKGESVDTQSSGIF